MVKLLLKHNVFGINYNSGVFGTILHYAMQYYFGAFPKWFQLESDVIDYLNMVEIRNVN